MINDEERKITISDVNGNEYQTEIVFTYENEERGTKYVFFFDPADPENVIPMRYKDDGTLEEYERKDLENLYDCYSRMGGNNYVHSLYEEMTHWPIKR